MHTECLVGISCETLERRLREGVCQLVDGFFGISSVEPRGDVTRALDSRFCSAFQTYRCFMSMLLLTVTLVVWRERVTGI
jgi:hypothetical protein